MNENEIKVGNELIYNGLGADRKGTVIKRTVRTITMKLQFSILKMTFKKNCLASDIGLRLA